MNLEIITKIVERFGAVKEAVKKAAFRNFGHAANRIMIDARASIEKSEKASEPGTPPHTRGRRGHSLKTGIRYAADDNGAVIGPAFSIVGTSGKAQEFGGEYKGETYPARPYMRPALEKNVPRFAGDWAGSIGE